MDPNAAGQMLGAPLQAMLRLVSLGRFGQG